MSRSRWLFLAGVLVICGIAAAAQAQRRSISAVDGRGKRIELPRPPMRIVSLTPSNTEILFALGLNGRIVADTSQCNYPPEASRLPHIGDYRISVEQVIAQKPDLVVAVTSANHAAIDQLERLRIQVFAVDPHNTDELYASILVLGRITGSEPQAKNIVTGMQARIGALKARIARARTRPKVLVVVQSQPLMIAGSNNFLDEAVELAGGTNVGREAGSGFPMFSTETVVIRAPDVIMGRPDLVNRAGWSAIPAVRRHAIFSPPPDTFSRPTPRLIDGIEYIARKLHPELFQAPRARGAA